MPDVYKGKPYMTEEYYEKREIDNSFIKPRPMAVRPKKV